MHAALFSDWIENDAPNDHKDGFKAGSGCADAQDARGGESDSHCIAPMKMSFSRFVDVVLVVSALTAVGVILSRRESPPRSDTATPTLAVVRSHWAQLRSSGSRLGSATASTAIVEFSDYECPFCRRSDSVVADFLSRRSDVALVYRHLPLTELHPRAEDAARLAICAGTQNKFPEMHEFLMAMVSGPTLSDSRLRRAAAAVGIPDPGELTRCLYSESTQETLDTDRALATAIGIQGTPVFVSQHGVHRGEVFGSADLEALLGN